MKKKKMNLSDLKVTSFITSADFVMGGASGVDVCKVSAPFCGVSVPQPTTLVQAVSYEQQMCFSQAFDLAATCALMKGVASDRADICG